MLNYFIKNPKLSLLILINVLCLGIVFSFNDDLSTNKVIKIVHSDIYFNSRSPDPALSKLSEFSVDRKSEAKRISISFKMKALDDNYDNVFQTANDPHTLRFELTHPNTASLIIGNDKSEVIIHKITDNLTLNAWHNVTIAVDEDKKIEVYLDGLKKLVVLDKSIMYDIADIAVGTGYNKLRGFQGEIKDFTIQCERYEQRSLFRLIMLFTSCLFISTCYLLLYNFLVVDQTAGSIGTDADELVMVPGIALLTLFSGYFASLILPLHSQWIPFILLGLVTPLMAFLCGWCLKADIFPRFYRNMAKVTLGLTFLFAVLLLLYHSFVPPLQLSPRLLILLIGSTTIYVTSKAGYLKMSLKNGSRKRWMVTVAIILLSVSFWCGLFELPNWSQFANSMKEHSAASTIIYLFSLTFVIHYVFDRTSSPLPGAYSFIYSKTGRLLPVFFFVFSFIIFFLMSFRFDTFFAGSSEGHWEYFVGPIRNIKNGSWLLWDTPSQYGFLNILTAAALPVSSAWQSLYVLQGILLFIAAVLIFITFLSKDRANVYFAFIITVSSLFFADPDLIGPYLFPSSSVMRFFWCYVLLFFFYWTHRRERMALKQVVLWGTVLWLMGFFWSSESAIYTTVTYFIGLIAAIYQRTYDGRGDIGKHRAVGKTMVFQLSIPIAALLLLIGIVGIYYRITLGHFPDLFVFVEHGFAYAGGFGSVQLNPYGSVWILFLLFCTLLTIIVRLILKDPLNRNVVPLVASAACLWAVSSYFIGRAVPNNITAMLPILCIITAIVLKSINGLDFDLSHIMFKVISVPLLMLILMTSFGNVNFVNKLRTFQTLTGNVSQKVRVADPSLQELISEAGIRITDPVVYYGHAAAMPRWKSNNGMVISEKTWLPNPLQLLEEPIMDERCSIYLRRFMQRSGQSGYFIQAKGEDEDRFTKWLVLITRTHLPIRTFENSKWKIIYFDRVKSL